jgi:glycosyltransferase involved in cell wall biosynthesis
MVTAYIPYFNNKTTIQAAIDGIYGQSIIPDELIIIDDGSKQKFDTSCRLGKKVIYHDYNRGRGAVRARAMTEARHEFVVCCDATNVLSSNFLEKGQPWFEDSKVAAVFGRITQSKPRNTVERWRGRHLFKTEYALITPAHNQLLATYAAMVRKSAVIQVGNYDSHLRHSEDVDLGARLLAAGWDVIYDPSMVVTSIATNTLNQVLERYWRWHAGKEEVANWWEYCRQIVYSIKVMAKDDLRAGDPLAALISLISPHYQFWRSLISKHCRKSNDVPWID